MKKLKDDPFLPVALAMYRFWVKMCELNGMEKNLVWLHKAHKEVVKCLKRLPVK